MAIKEDYAALSAIVYNNVRGEANKLLLPPNWTFLTTSDTKVKAASQYFLNNHATSPTH